MYRCNECGTIFENRSRSCEPYDEFSYPEYEQWLCCPGCGGDDLDQLAPCPICGGWSEDDICVECCEHISEGMLEILNNLGFLDDPAERAVLAVMSDWIERR